MRLIDGDALINETMERYCSDCERRKGVKNGKWKIVYSIGDAPCRACGIGDMIDELEDAPTITQNPDEWCTDCKEYDAEKHSCPRFNHVIRKAMERKKGQWRNIQIGEWLGVECTACKMAYDRREVPHVNGGGVAWYFCPECGADMRSNDNG